MPRATEKSDKREYPYRGSPFSIVPSKTPTLALKLSSLVPSATSDGILIDAVSKSEYENLYAVIVSGLSLVKISNIWSDVSAVKSVPIPKPTVVP